MRKVMSQITLVLLILFSQIIQLLLIPRWIGATETVSQRNGMVEATGESEWRETKQDASIEAEQHALARLSCFLNPDVKTEKKKFGDSDGFNESYQSVEQQCQVRFNQTPKVTEVDHLEKERKTPAGPEIQHKVIVRVTVKKSLVQTVRTARDIQNDTRDMLLEMLQADKQRQAELEKQNQQLEEKDNKLKEETAEHFRRKQEFEEDQKREREMTKKEREQLDKEKLEWERKEADLNRRSKQLESEHNKLRSQLEQQQNEKKARLIELEELEKKRLEEEQALKKLRMERKQEELQAILNRGQQKLYKLLPPPKPKPAPSIENEPVNQKKSADSGPIENEDGTYDLPKETKKPLPPTNIFSQESSVEWSKGAKGAMTDHCMTSPHSKVCITKTEMKKKREAKKQEMEKKRRDKAKEMENARNKTKPCQHKGQRVEHGIRVVTNVGTRTNYNQRCSYQVESVCANGKLLYAERKEDCREIPKPKPKPKKSCRLNGRT